jgi:hypothetical protein
MTTEGVPQEVVGDVFGPTVPIRRGRNGQRNDFGNDDLRSSAVRRSYPDGKGHAQNGR